MFRSAGNQIQHSSLEKYFVLDSLSKHLNLKKPKIWIVEIHSIDSNWEHKFAWWIEGKGCRLGFKSIFSISRPSDIGFVDSRNGIVCKQNYEDGYNNKRGDSTWSSLVVFVLVVAQELSDWEEVKIFDKVADTLFTLHIYESSNKIKVITIYLINLF